MRIIIVSNSLWNVINFRGNFLEDLIKKNYKILIIAQKNYEDPLFDSKNLKIIDYKFYSNFNSFILNFKNLYKLYTEIKNFKPSLVLSFSMIPNIFVGFTSFFFNKIFFINTFTGLGNSLISGKTNQIITLLILKLSQKKINQLFFHNKNDQKLFFEHGLTTKQNSKVVLGSGIRFSNYKLENKKTKNNKSFLFIGRLITTKGIIEYIEASKKILEKFPNTQIGILGDYNKNHSKSISQITYKKIKSSRKFEYYRYISDHKKYNNLINLYDCIVLPSYREGLPKSLVESCFLGKSIIATNTVGMDEVSIDGINGFRCDVKSIDSLYKAMEKIILIDDKKYQIFSKNSQNIALKFDHKKVFKKYFEIIDELNLMIK